MTERDVSAPSSRAGALEELYVRHAPSAFRTAYLMTSDRELAEDIAQDAFVRVAARFRHVRTPEAFPAYLRRTVVNLSLSRLRRRKLERANLEATRSSAAPAVDVEERDELWTAIERLAPRQRAVVVLRYYEDLSEREAAAVMRCSVAAVKSLTARAMRSLREITGSEET
jgi:RNA polymerase sigma-70 factor (sigma-E family)